MSNAIQRVKVEAQDEWIITFVFTIWLCGSNRSARRLREGYELVVRRLPDQLPLLLVTAFLFSLSSGLATVFTKSTLPVKEAVVYPQYSGNIEL